MPNENTDESFDIFHRQNIGIAIQKSFDLLFVDTSLNDLTIHLPFQCLDIAVKFTACHLQRTVRCILMVR